MQITVEIPDAFAQRLRLTGAGDLARRVLESLPASAYRSGHLDKPELRRILSLEAGDQIDGL